MQVNGDAPNRSGTHFGESQGISMDLSAAARCRYSLRFVQFHVHWIRLRASTACFSAKYSARLAVFAGTQQYAV